MSQNKDKQNPSDDGSYDFAPTEPGPKPEITRAPQPIDRPAEKKTARETPSDQPAPRTPARQPEPELTERTCPHCGFRIVGKAPRGRCPDCAALLDEVTTGRLQFASAAWVNGLSVGTLFIAIAIAVHAGAIVLGWMRKTELPQADLATLVHVIAATVGMIGVWMATRPEPGIGTTQSPLGMPARWIAVAVLLLWILPLVKGSPEETADHTMPPDRVMALVLAGMALEAILVGLHLRWLANRIPNDSLISQFLNLAYIVAAAITGLIVLQLLGQANTKGMSDKFLCGFSIIGALAVIFLWAAFALAKMSIELRNCVVAGRNIETRKQLRAQQAQEKKKR